MNCSELPFTPTEVKVELGQLLRLEKKARLMLNERFEQAWKLREQAPEKHTPAFMTAWEVLSASAEVTSGLFNPNDWVPAIGQDAAWAEKFNDLMENPKSLTRMYGKRFAQLWPIFDVRAARQQGVLQAEAPTRAEAQLVYSRAGVPGVPACWQAHAHETPVPVPDWQHTVPAWEAVRRNLFQDPAWNHTENDTRIISNAFLSLIYFLKESHLYFENPSLSPDIFDRTQVLSSL